MAVGLTAEALVHEIRHVTDNLAERTSAIQTHVKSGEVSEQKIAAYFRTSCAGVVRRSDRLRYV
jgi:hypothetical protein